MLKRIYIDNFRCLVDFELEFDEVNLFVGLNGSGKSSVFDLLRKIQGFVSYGQKVASLFKPEGLTRWQTSLIQTFELEIVGNEGTYNYELAIRHDEALRHAQVAYERLSFDNNLLLSFELGTVQRYRDDRSLVPAYAFSCEQSAISLLPPENSRLTWFRERMKRFIIVQAMPQFMERESAQPEAQLMAGMENYDSFLRHVSQDQDKIGEITNVLKEKYEFDSLRFANGHKANSVLNLSFSDKNNGHHPIEYGFHEMATGDQALISLYSLIYYVRNSDYTLALDEPENFLPLEEIQPLLWELYDACDEQLQTMIISHHPQFINLSALFVRYWFDRVGNSPTWARPLRHSDKHGAPMKKFVAGSWIYDY